MSDCKEIDQLLDQQHGAQEPIPTGAEAHLKVCGRCRALVTSLEREPESFNLSAAAINQLSEPILHDLKPVRPLPPTPVFLLIFLALFLALSGMGVYRLGTVGWQVLSDFQRAAMFTSLAASAALLTLSTVRQMVPGSRYRFPPQLLPAVVLAFLCLVVAGLFQYRSDPNFVRTGMGCLRAGAPYAIIAAGVFWALLSRGAALHPYLAGITSGLLAGIIGTSVIEMHCPILDVWHILVWHLGVSFVGGLVGLLFAALGVALRRWNEVRRQTP